MSEVPPRNALNLWKNGAVALALEGADGQARMLGEHNPLPVAFAPGAASDPDSAREVTLQQVLTALLALGGNTDGLEALATQQKAVLDQMAAYVNDVEGLLTLIGNSTDGLEGLLSALGVKDDNVLAKLTEILAKNEQIRALVAGTLAISAAALPLPTGASTEATLAAQKAVIDAVKARLDLLASETKLEQVRALLAALPLPAGASTSALQTAGNTVLSNILTAVGLLGTEATQVAIRNAVTGTLATRRAATAPGSSASAIAAGSSQGADQDLSGLSVSRIIIGANWTAADMTFETSADGVTWSPLYDAYGNVIQYRVAASRAVNVPVGDLLNINRIRPRSGVPGAYVNQAAAATVTFITGVF